MKISKFLNEEFDQKIILTARNGREIIVKIKHGVIESIDNKAGIRFPFSEKQPFNRNMEVWAENNNFKWNGHSLGSDKVFGMKKKDIPKGHELRMLFPNKFR